MIRSIVKIIYSNKKIDELNNKKILSNNKINEYNFLFIRLITCIGLFILLSFTSNYGYIFAPMTIIIIYFSWENSLYDKRIKKRIITLEKDAVYFFEGILLALKSGKNIKESIKICCDNIDSDLSKEFKLTLIEIENGKNINIAFKNLINKIPSIKIKSIVQLFIQANKLGSDIISSLEYQLKDIRYYNFVLTKYKMRRIPIYVIIASIIFFLPVIIIVIFIPEFVKILT